MVFGAKIKSEELSFDEKIRVLERLRDRNRSDCGDWFEARPEAKNSKKILSFRSALFARGICFS